MPTLTKLVLTGCLGATVLVMAACGSRQSTPVSVTELMEDRVTLDGVLMKCNQHQSEARTDSDCLNARIAIDRLARQNESIEDAKRMQEFERSRERLRMSQDKQRQEQEAKSKVDGYSLPVVPVEPVPSSPEVSHTTANAPIVRQSNL